MRALTAHEPIAPSLFEPLVQPLQLFGRKHFGEFCARGIQHGPGFHPNLRLMRGHSLPCTLQYGANRRSLFLILRLHDVLNEAYEAPFRSQ